MLAHRKYVFQREWFKVEAITSVIISRDGLGIAVNHDRLIAVVTQSERRMATTVIKLDSLPDPIWPAPQYDDLLLLSRLSFVFFLVGRVEVRRIAFKLGGASVYALIDRR